MRNTHLVRGWEWWIVVLLLFVLVPATTLFANQENQQGIKLKLTGVKFQTLMKQIAEGSGLKLVMLLGDDPADNPIVDADFPTPTPAETIIVQETKSVGLDFWKSGDTCYIGKPKSVVVTPAPSIDPTPVSTTPSTEPTSPMMPSTVTTATPPADKSVFRRIDLQNMSVSDLMFMLGKPVEPIDAQRQKVLENRFEKVVDSRQSLNVNLDTSVNSGNSASAPWLSGASGQFSRDASSTDAPAIPRTVRRWGRDGGWRYRIYPRHPWRHGRVSGRNSRATWWGYRYDRCHGSKTGATGAGGAGGGSLKEFIPKGILNIIGLIGLDAILVRAETDDDIEQLRLLIKMLDQPVKQVIVEVMFMDMTVNDALDVESSLEYAGMPLSMLANNGGNTGNFGLQYIKGNFRASLSSLLSKSWNKVVNAPRVVVQNGHTASIEFTGSIPSFKWTRKKMCLDAPSINQKSTRRRSSRG